MSWLKFMVRFTCYVFISLQFRHANGYIYCDPFSQQKMLRCICGFLDYADVHSPASAYQKEPLLCERYQDFKNCTKHISVLCRTSVIGHLEALYDNLCHSSFKESCKFQLSVDMSHSPIKPLCDNQYCYVTHGAKATLTPSACPNATFQIHTSRNLSIIVTKAVNTVSFSCSDGVLSASGFQGGDINGITSIECSAASNSTPSCTFSTNIPTGGFTNHKLECVREVVKTDPTTLALDPGRQICTVPYAEYFIIHPQVCARLIGDDANPTDPVGSGRFVINSATTPVSVTSEMTYECGTNVVGGLDTLTGVGLPGSPISVIESIDCPTKNCVFETSIPQSNFAGSYLECSYQTAGGSSVCRAAYGEYFTINPTACPSVTTNAGDFIINGGNAVTILNTAQIMYSCNNNAVDTLKYTDATTGAQTVTQLTSIGCPAAPGCTFSTNIPTGGFTGHNLDCTRVKINTDPNDKTMAAGSQICMVPYGKTFTISAQACPKLVGDAPGNGRFILNPNPGVTDPVLATGDITYSCGYNAADGTFETLVVPGVGTFTTLDSINCPDTTCAFQTSLPQASFAGANVECTYVGAGGVTSNCVVKYAEVFTIRMGACPSLTAGAGDFAINGNTITITTDLEYSCAYNGEDTLAYTGGPTTPVTSISCPTDTCGFTTNVPTGGFTDHNLNCDRISVNTDPTDMTQTPGQEQCRAAGGETFQIYPRACANGIFLINGVIDRFPPNDPITYICNIGTGVDVLTTTDGTVITGITSIMCPSTLCDFETSIPTAGFDGHHLQCNRVTGPTFDPFDTPVGQEQCAVLNQDTFTIRSDACPNGNFLINGNAVQLTGSIAYSCGPTGIDTLGGPALGAGNAITPVHTIGCSLQTCSFQKALPIGSFTSIADGSVKCTTKNVGTSETCAMTDRAIISVHANGCGTDDVLYQPGNRNVAAGTAFQIECFEGDAYIGANVVTEVGCEETTCRLITRLPAGSFVSIVSGHMECVRSGTQAKTDICTMTSDTVVTVYREACGTDASAGFLFDGIEVINPAADFTLSCDGNGQITASTPNTVITEIGCKGSGSLDWVDANNVGCWDACTNNGYAFAVTSTVAHPDAGEYYVCAFTVQLTGFRIGYQLQTNPRCVAANAGVATPSTVFQCLCSLL